MLKTIDLSEEHIKKIEQFGEQTGKDFAESLRSIIANHNDASFLSDDNFALIADALIELNRKVEMLLLINKLNCGKKKKEIYDDMPPYSAGEVKK